MAIAVVNGTLANTATSVTNTVSSGAISITGGNTIIVWTFDYTTSGLDDDTATPISDSTGSNTYTLVKSSGVLATNYIGKLWYAKNVTGGASVTFTYSQTTAGNNFPGFVLIQVSGLSTTAPLDQGSAAYVLNGSGTTNSITTTSASELLVSVGFINGVGPISSSFTNGGCTTSTGTITQQQVTNSSASLNGAIGTAIVAATGTYCSTWSATGNPPYAVNLFSFQAAGAAVIPPGLGPVAQMQEPFHFDSASMR